MSGCEIMTTCIYINLWTETLWVKNKNRRNSFRIIYFHCTIRLLGLSSRISRLLGLSSISQKHMTINRVFNAWYDTINMHDMMQYDMNVSKSRCLHWPPQVPYLDPVSSYDISDFIFGRKVNQTVHFFIIFL